MEKFLYEKERIIVVSVYEAVKSMNGEIQSLA